MTLACRACGAWDTTILAWGYLPRLPQSARGRAEAVAAVTLKEAAALLGVTPDNLRRNLAYTLR